MIKVLLIFFSVTFLITVNITCQTTDIKSLTKVVISTDSGDIRLVLYDETRLHKENFIKLVKEGYYDGQLFHRLIKNFMLQGGDPNSKNAERGEILGQGGPGYTIPSEINPIYFHKKGALAAARKGDEANPSKASSGSQFYIIQGSLFSQNQLDQMVMRQKHTPFTEAEISAYTKTGGSPHLDGGYTVFGEVYEGLDVLDKLMNVPVDAYNRPLADLHFTIKILE
jgi:peptidyl-prolyl cis-trans isomerase B (cyclophilin B)